MSPTNYTMHPQKSQGKDMDLPRVILLVIVTVTKVSCKHGLWLVVRVNNKAVADFPTTALLCYIRILFLQFQLIHCQFQSTHNSLIIIQAWQYNIIIQIIHLFCLNITGHLFSYFFSD